MPTPSEKKVLIVDDNEINRDILETIFEAKYQLMSADSGETALSLIPDFMPDIVLLDIMMSGIDGYDVCRRIKSNTHYNAIKVVMLSGQYADEERQKCIDVGAFEYISKPFDVDEIRSVINRIERD